MSEKDIQRAINRGAEIKRIAHEALRRGHRLIVAAAANNVIRIHEILREETVPEDVYFGAILAAATNSAFTSLRALALSNEERMFAVSNVGNWQVANTLIQTAVDPHQLQHDIDTLESFSGYNGPD